MIKRPEQNYDQISLPDLKEYTVCKDKLIAENSVNDFIFKIVFKTISFTYSVHLQEIASCFLYVFFYFPLPPVTFVFYIIQLKSYHR